MIATVDAQYRRETAAVGCVTFGAWTDPLPAREVTLVVHDVAAYVPGEFWQRELPCILSALSKLDRRPDIVVVDGYVWLDRNHRKGLGAHLFDALAGKSAVVGVAKTPFQGSAHCELVWHGESQRPLYVTAQGIPPSDAAVAVASMHGAHRIPTLLKRVDQLCRSALAETQPWQHRGTGNG